MPPVGAPGKIRLRIWDLPIRVFHWAVVILVAGLWWTAHHDQMTAHRLFGYILSGLLLFRICWGFFGGSTARFSAFVKGPIAVMRYAGGLFRPKGREPEIGHNPMGAWSVLALLALLAAEVGLGLFSVDVDGEESGPLADRISFDGGRIAAHWHHLLFNVLLAMVVLHVAAIAFYLVVRRDNLIAPMITGSKSASEEQRSLRPASARRFWVAAAIAVLGAYLVARGFR